MRRTGRDFDKESAGAQVSRPQSAVDKAVAEANAYNEKLRADRAKGIGSGFEDGRGGRERFVGDKDPREVAADNKEGAGADSDNKGSGRERFIGEEDARNVGPER